MSIQDLLGETAKERFVEEHFLRLPFSRPGGCRQYHHLGAWDSLGQILAAADEADVLVVRRGERVNSAEPRTAADARRLCGEGCTVVVRRAEMHHPELRKLAASFAAELGGKVNIHVFATPAGEHGFGWHYDAEEVFILQLTGGKEYSLRKNTVNPWPLMETLPEDMRYEREIMPLVRCSLTAGDWLYIPSGYWHRAEASGLNEPAVSLSIGVAAPTAMDAFDALRPRLLESLVWRQRLPTLGDASPLDDEALVRQLAPLGEQLGRDLQRTLADEEFWRDVVSTLRSEARTDVAPEQT